MGFMAVDRLAEKCGISVKRLKHRALIGEGRIGGQRALLVKPQVYMNNSGQSLGEIVRYYGVPLDHVIVIYDDISLDVGKIRVRAKGSAGGHNGMKNIILHLGTEAFPRIRVGIGEKPARMDLADYVLSRFTPEEAPIIRDSVDLAREACVTILENGIDAAMNRFN